MRRRDFITILTGSAAAWPLAATAQVPARPVIGYLGGQAPDPQLLARFHEGLNELGYFEGRNVDIEYRWAFNQYHRLPALAAELVQRRVALIVTGGGWVAAKAAKEATTRIPILFVSGLDPVGGRQEGGLVVSLNRPGGNATGVTHDPGQLTQKRLELLWELLGEAKSRESLKVAYLANDDTTGLGPAQQARIEDEHRMAAAIGLMVLYARSDGDIEAAIAAAADSRVDGVLVTSDPLFISQRALIVALAARYALPTNYRNREFTDAGGLMSYGPSLPDSWRQIGRYAGRILNGARPEDLPVLLQRKLELVINLKTAAMLGLTVPPLLRAVADEVIE
jgi:putative ABC transport system substrate-binding protein